LREWDRIKGKKEKIKDDQTTVSITARESVSNDYDEPMSPKIGNEKGGDSSSKK